MEGGEGCVWVLWGLHGFIPDLSESKEVKAPVHAAGMAHCLWENIFKKLGKT